MQRNEEACFEPRRVSGTSGVKPVLIPCVSIVLSPSTKWSPKELGRSGFSLRHAKLRIWLGELCGIG